MRRQRKYHFGCLIVVGGKPQEFTIVLANVALFRSRKLHSIFDDCIEDRLHIGWGAADHAKNLARGRLLFQGFGQLFVAILQFLQQADILDRYYRLVGKGCQQFNLLFGERLDFAPSDYNPSKEVAFSEQRNS